jgi:hypothetical protein
MKKLLVLAVVVIVVIVVLKKMFPKSFDATKVKVKDLQAKGKGKISLLDEAIAERISSKKAA